ncbi:MAG TPA: hypothetical protein PL110_08935 [Candidatus Eremiobacteraeota bacterium]|mgnify:CR=1 FL=1|nr:MAG: hypothetical protein BWY64_00040 [bacterium ADurb.Bin363]HPZ08226.1 hypothetical protein [Candidatus Eremiobacteraeota bacterium]
MTIKEYVDLINDWNSDIPMNMSILITKAIRKFLSSYPNYKDTSEFTSDIMEKIKNIIIRDNGKTQWEEATIYIDSFIGHLKE